jgi:hypothetical protein
MCRLRQANYPRQQDSRAAAAIGSVNSDIMQVLRTTWKSQPRTPVACWRGATVIAVQVAELNAAADQVWTTGRGWMR